jgi:hypothetical protein
MPFYPHGIKRLGSPGYDLELAYSNYLLDHALVRDFDWLSENKKAVFDFVVYTGIYDSSYLEYRVRNRKKFLIDCVGSYYFGHSMRLNTRHKNWYELLDYSKEQHADACYLVFNPMYEYTDIDNWRYLKITEDLPTNNIFLSKARLRGLRTSNYIFSDKRTQQTIMRDKIRFKYAPRKEKENELMQWIYTDVKV